MAEGKEEAPIYVYHTLGILEEDLDVESSCVPPSLYTNSETGFQSTTDSAEFLTPVSATIKSTSLVSETDFASQDDARDLLFAGITPTSATPLDESNQRIGFSDGEIDENIEDLLGSTQSDSLGLPFSNSNADEDVGFLSLDVEETVEANLREQADEKAKSSENGTDTAREVPPWARKDDFSGRSFRSPLLQLHQEIVDFCNFVAPTEKEKVLRAAAIDRVSTVVKSIWPSCQVKVFGSFATGLYLPTSDCDVVILESGCVIVQDGLKAIAKALNRKSLIKKLQIIGKARVPIIKFVETQSNISFDISFDVANGPDAASFIKEAMSALPPLKPLCMVLKFFLQQRELNEVYTGGIGSYALLVMLMNHLQMHPSRKVSNSRGDLSPLESNLGVLLVDFFDFYGRALNVKEVGISCRSGGRFYTKASRGFVDSVRPYLLSVEDPQAPDNDIGKNSFNVTKVRAAFLLAHRVLTKLEVEGVQEHVGLLGRIVRVDEKVLGRKYTPAPRPQRLSSTGRLHDESNIGSSSAYTTLHNSRHMMTRNRSWSRWPEFQDDDFPRGSELDHSSPLGWRKTQTEETETEDHERTPSHNPGRRHNRRGNSFSQEVDPSPHKKQRSMERDPVHSTLTWRKEQVGSEKSSPADKRPWDKKVAKQKPPETGPNDNRTRRQTPDGKKRKGKRQRDVLEEDPIEEGEIVFKSDFPTSVPGDGRHRESYGHGEGSGHGSHTRWFDKARSSKPSRFQDMGNGSVRSRKKIERICRMDEAAPKPPFVPNAEVTMSQAFPGRGFTRGAVSGSPDHLGDYATGDELAKVAGLACVEHACFGVPQDQLSYSEKYGQAGASKLVGKEAFLVPLMWWRLDYLTSSSLR